MLASAAHTNTWYAMQQVYDATMRKPKPNLVDVVYQA